MFETLLGNQTLMISLDVDNSIFDRLHDIAAAGYSLIEINSTDPKILKAVIHAFPGLKIGAGNITHLEDLENAYKAGVHFAASPGFLPTLAQTASIYSMKYLPGIATISEAMQVMSLGYQFARPLPATLSFCTLLNKYLPALKLIPSDLEQEEIEHFLNLPAVAAVTLHNPEKKFLQSLSSGMLVQERENLK